VLEVRRKVNFVILMKHFPHVHPRIRAATIRIGRGGGAVCREVTRAKRFIAVHARREDGYSTNAVLIWKAIQNNGGHHEEIR
jgi:hypothetical protein